MRQGLILTDNMFFFTCVLTTYSPILRVNIAVFFTFLKPREADLAVPLLLMDTCAACIPVFIAWVASDLTDLWSDLSKEGAGLGVEAFSGLAVLFTSRAVVAKMCFPVLGSITG